MQTYILTHMHPDYISIISSFFYVQKQPLFFATDHCFNLICAAEDQEMKVPGNSWTVTYKTDSENKVKILIVATDVFSLSLSLSHPSLSLL